MKTCLRCGKLFESVDKKQRFCSISCGLTVKVTRVVICVDCGATVVHVGRGRRLRCAACQRKNAVQRTIKHRIKIGSLRNPGVGSGGAQWGAANHQWKPLDQHKSTKYTGNYRTRCFRVWGRSCVICGGTDEIAAHHVDGDPANLTSSNLVPLCPRCHGKVHRRKWKLVAQYERALFSLWPSGRIKIAEKTGTPSSGQSERKETGNTVATRND
jgi:hypothetical protein